MIQQPNVMSLDDFLGHRTSDGGGGVFLKWNKRNPPMANVWLHTRAPFLAVWQHGFPRIVERKDDTTGEIHEEVWGSSWNCWEGEAVLKRQYFRDRQTGRRTTPPIICPKCKLIEAVRILVETGKLRWTQPIFEFSVGHKSDRVLHAGGLYNAFARQDLTREELDELKEARIYRSEAWKENSMAKCLYIFRVVDNDHPEEGVMISIEGSGLGDKVKAAIRDKQTSVGMEAGNPILNPYAIRWEHRPDERSFNDRYRAIVMDGIAITPEINRLITEIDPPDVSNLVKPGNPKLLRATMERYWCGPNVIDWDEIFHDVEMKFAESGNDPTDFQFGENRTKSTAKRTTRPFAEEIKQVETIVNAEPAQSGMNKTVEDDGDEEIVACDECDADMLATDPVCKNCGKMYEEIEEKLVPKPKRRCRSYVGETRQMNEQAKSRMQRASTAGAVDSWGSEAGNGDPFDDDDIPF